VFQETLAYGDKETLCRIKETLFIVVLFFVECWWRWSDFSTTRLGIWSIPASEILSLWLVDSETFTQYNVDRTDELTKAAFAVSSGKTVTEGHRKQWSTINEIHWRSIPKIRYTHLTTQVKLIKLLS